MKIDYGYPGVDSTLEVLYKGDERLRVVYLLASLNALIISSGDFPKLSRET